MEEWKDVVGYEGLYKVSNYGNLFSCRRGIVMKQTTTKKGYLSCGLCVGGKQKIHAVHRVVASAFLPNPYNLPQVNHKDECKTNNRVENLEWCTDEYNRHYGTTVEKAAKGHYKKVDQYALDGKLIRTWDGISVAADTLGVSRTHITDCCKGGLNKTGGFMWKYHEERCLKSNLPEI